MKHVKRQEKENDSIKKTRGRTAAEEEQGKKKKGKEYIFGPCNTPGFFTHFLLAHPHRYPGE